MKEILSPITLQNNVKKILDIPSATIVDLYKNEYNIDISKEFKDCANISIYKCHYTSLMFYNPMIAGDGKFYEQLQKIPWYYPTWKWENDQVLSFIKPNSTVLEIGCGDGHFLEKTKINKNIIPLGIELNKLAAKNVQNKGIEIVTDTLEVFSKNTIKKFDFICCFQVLEHISNIREFIECCISLLNKDGILAFAVPNNTPYLFGYDVFHTLNLPPHHQSLWNAKVFKQLPTVFTDLELVSISTEPLDNIQVTAYMNSYKRYFKKDKIIYILIRKFLPKFLWVKAAKFLRIEGRNVVVVFKKK